MDLAERTNKMNPVDTALAELTAKAKARAAAIARDEARQTTVTVDFVNFFGDELTITVTGIAPFEAVPTRKLTGVEGWTVSGQPSTARQPRKAIRHDGPSSIRGEVWGGLPLMREDDARRLASLLNAQIRQVA
jgi:hypothetical protein